MLYTEEQLREDFAGTEILLLKTSPCVLNEGAFHRGPAVTVRLIAIKR